MFNSITVQPLDSQHISETLAKIPQRFHSSILADYERKYPESRKDANLGLLDIQQYSKGKKFLNYDDESLRDKADRLSRHAHCVIRQGGIEAGLALLASHQLEAPKSDSDESLKARLVDKQFWIRQLVKKHDREFEETAIRFGMVRKHKQPYISNRSNERVQARRKRSLHIMADMEAVNDEGETLNMLDVVKSSIANPEILRAELMTRLVGFELYAKQQEHSAEFYTLTAPSKYHPSSAKYNGAVPRKVQGDYFRPLWARIRAKLQYDGLPVYGFRIAEPHADGCPHWHMLLFMKPSHVKKVRAILSDYALREDGGELGAKKHRFTYEAINPKKGSAVGYIAKYIAKNVDGFGMDGEIDDETGKPVNESAQRVRSWASLWGIRQFQQIGGSSITVWRELRRVEDEQDNTTIEQARKAADSGDWCEYLKAQGGADMPFKDQPIKSMRDFRCDPFTGAIQENRYGELVQYVKGVIATGTAIETRLKHWTIQLKATESKEQSKPESVDDATSRLLKKANQYGIRAPWSSVNNCRKPPDEDEIFKEVMAFEKPYLEKEGVIE